MLLEPPRSRVPGRSGRAPAPLLNTARLRVRRRTAPLPAVPARGAELDVPRIACLVAAFVLAVSSRGDVVVLAVLLGFGAARRGSGIAAAAALGAALVRWGSPSLGAIAGAQAVLGPAGWTGSRAAVASAWLGALALVAAASPLVRDNLRVRLLSVSPFAIAAADLVVGPAVGGAIAWRIVGSVVALALTTFVTRWRWPVPWLAELLSAAALVCAGIGR